MKAHVKLVKKTNERKAELMYERLVRLLKNSGEDWSKKTRSDDKKDALEQKTVRAR